MLSLGHWVSYDPEYAYTAFSKCISNFVKTIGIRYYNDANIWEKETKEQVIRANYQILELGFESLKILFKSFTLNHHTQHYKNVLIFFENLFCFYLLHLNL